MLAGLVDSPDTQRAFREKYQAYLITSHAKLAHGL
jgi:hypothetical protein